MDTGVFFYTTTEESCCKFFNRAEREKSEKKYQYIYSQNINFWLQQLFDLYTKIAY